MTHNFAPPCTTLAEDPSADRLIYASFPQCLRNAMKIAAKRFSWTPEDWRMQTLMLQDAMLAGWYSPEEIADAYAKPPPGGAD